MAEISGIMSRKFGVAASLFLFR